MNNARPHHQRSASGARRGFRPAFVDDLAFNSWGIAYFVLATIVKATGLWQHMHDEIHIAFLQGEVAYRKALLEYCEMMGPSLMMHLPGVYEDAEIKGCPRISRLIKDLNGEDYFERLEAERLANERRFTAKLPNPVRSEERGFGSVSKTIGTNQPPTPGFRDGRSSLLNPVGVGGDALIDPQENESRCLRMNAQHDFFTSPLWSAPARNMGLTNSGPDPPATTGSHLWQKSYMSPGLLSLLPHT